MPILETDPLGHQHKIYYRQTDHLEKEIIDPSGKRTLEIYDRLQRVREIKILSSSNTLLAHTRFNYDGRDNQISRHEEVLLDGNLIDNYNIATVYDGMNQKVRESEQNVKTTEWTYEKGRLHTLKMADGVVLTHRYDSLGRLQEQSSSDKTIHYSYIYDLNDNLLKVEDLIN